MRLFNQRPSLSRENASDSRESITGSPALRRELRNAAPYKPEVRILAQNLRRSVVRLRAVGRHYTRRKLNSLAEPLRSRAARQQRKFQPEFHYLCAKLLKLLGLGALIGSRLSLENGNIDLEDFRAKAEENKERLAASMITYPSTHGIF